MNHLKCNLRTILGQNTLSDLMQMRSSYHAMKAYSPHSAISNWFSRAKTKRHIVKTFKLNTGISKLSANFLMMFISGTSFMLAVQPRKSHCSLFNCFIVNTLGKPLKALSNINIIDNVLHPEMHLLLDAENIEWRDQLDAEKNRMFMQITISRKKQRHTIRKFVFRENSFYQQTKAEKPLRFLITFLSR